MDCTFTAELWQYDVEAPWGFVTFACRTLRGHPSQARPVGQIRRIDQGNGDNRRYALGDIVVPRALARPVRAPDPGLRPNGRATRGRFRCGGPARAALTPLLSTQAIGAIAGVAKSQMAEDVRGAQALRR